MDRRLRALPRASERHQQQQHRFLRPGALARLRDSRIVARSVRSSASLLLPRSAPPSPAPPVLAADEQASAPRFLGTTSGSGRYPLRRRVAAARGVAFLPPPSPSPGSEALLSGALPRWRRI